MTKYKTGVNSSHSPGVHCLHTPCLPQVPGCLLRSDQPRGPRTVLATLHVEMPEFLLNSSACFQITFFSWCALLVWLSPKNPRVKHLISKDLG